MWERVEGMRVLALGGLGERARENQLVLEGRRQGFLALYSDYLDDGELPETPGEHLALLSTAGRVVAVVEVDELTCMRVEDATLDHVALEGGGHPTLSAWREHHRARYEERGVAFHSRSEVVWLRFHLYSVRETPAPALAQVRAPLALPPSRSRPRLTTGG